MRGILSEIKSFLSCRDYSKGSSKKRDSKLGKYDLAKYYFHHVICFTCRRFSKQLDSIDQACCVLKESEPFLDQSLSEEVKAKILTTLRDSDSNH